MKFDLGKPLEGWRLRLYTIIFESDTRWGRRFDHALLAAIMFSIVVIAVDSVDAIHSRHATVFFWLEWSLTALFTLEYLTRIVCVRHPLRYMVSFYGLVDLLAILPTYLALVYPEIYALVDIRVLRLFRAFRIFRLTAYVNEYQGLGRALIASRRKIMVFLTAVMMIVLVMGTIMYIVEGPVNGFTSVPISVYWAITTMTTVGFGDITPKSDLGRMIASIMMLVGWGTLAVPTGILTAEISAQRTAHPPTTRTCHECLTEGHSPEANFCSHCGAHLPGYLTDSPAAPRLKPL